MINLALVTKSFREAAVTLIGASVGMVLFSVVFCWALLNMGTELLEFMQRFGFLRKIMEVGFGIDISGEVSTGSLMAVVFTHGMILIMSWATMIAISTANTIGEFESGTADLLLSLPVSRLEVYLSTSVVWVFAATLLGFCPQLGLWLATLIFEIPEPISLARYTTLSWSLAATLLAVGGMCCLFSMVLSRRTYVIAAVTGVGVYSMLINLVEPFVESIAFLKWSSLMNYFRPVDIYRNEGWPMVELSVLGGLGLICWTVGLVLFQRKEIPTG